MGKTHIAVGSGMEVLRRGYTVRYTTLDDLVRALRKADMLGNAPKEALLLPESAASHP